ncbi:MAG TPA: hypothetical protein VI588_00060 [Candidatus Gracilibacteria bacterium]|nr:hypothetical protein [Candidatus Gracilibacteria bacterium]
MTECCKKRNKILDNVLLVVLLTTFFMGGIVVGQKVLPHSLPQQDDQQKSAFTRDLAVKIASDVLPSEGFTSRISFGDSIIKLEEAGVIDREKMGQLYVNRGGMPEELAKLLDDPSSEPITINKENAAYLINLLWPLGIANANSTLAESDAAKPENVNRLAATGGWNLGKSDEGGDYYNQFEILALTPEQDELVKRVAKNIYRPCCGNSTAMPDCNHGAAMLGLLQLGAAQGLSEEELYDEALAFNSFWFPDNYQKMALAFQQFQNKSWSEIDPKMLLSADYSSGSGYRQNVLTPLSQVPGLLPQTSGGGSCSA